MADPTPMDVDDEAPTDLVPPDVMEGLLRVPAVTRQPLTDAAKTWTEAQATFKVALDLIGDHRRDAVFLGPPYVGNASLHR